MKEMNHEDLFEVDNKRKEKTPAFQASASPKCTRLREIPTIQTKLLMEIIYFPFLLFFSLTYSTKM